MKKLQPRDFFLNLPTDHIISYVPGNQSQEARLWSLKYFTSYYFLCGVVFKFYFGQIENCSGASCIVLVFIHMQACVHVAGRLQLLFPIQGMPSPNAKPLL